MAAKQLEALAGRTFSHLVRPGIGERGGTVVARLISPSLYEAVWTPGHGAVLHTFRVSPPSSGSPP